MADQDPLEEISHSTKPAPACPTCGRPFEPENGQQLQAIVEALRDVSMNIGFLAQAMTQRK